jgi:hypothetical protein
MPEKKKTQSNFKKEEEELTKISSVDPKRRKKRKRKRKEEEKEKSERGEGWGKKGRAPVC